MVALTLVGVLGGLRCSRSIGLYGVMSYAVSQSTRDWGCAWRLGANASNLFAPGHIARLGNAGGSVAGPAWWALAIDTMAWEPPIQGKPITTRWLFGSALTVMNHRLVGQRVFCPPGAHAD